MQASRENSTVTIYIKKPLKHSIPHLNNMQASKNPFHKSSFTLSLTKSSTINTDHRSFPEYTPAPELPSWPRPVSERVSKPGVQEDLSLDDDWEHFGETAVANDCFAEKGLSQEVMFHFSAMRALPVTEVKEVEKRTVELGKKPKGSSGKTLVLDMDDTLIHTLVPLFNYSRINVDHENAKTVIYEDSASSTLFSAKVIIRPYAIQLLQELSIIYEIVIFTAAEKCYADGILDLLDPENKYISHRIYRQNCIIKNRHTSKDLRIFKDRDINNIVIVDNTITCFSEHLSNGIHVPSYFGEQGDNSLEKVLKLLKEIADCRSIPEALDERVGLRKLYNQFTKW